MEAIQNQRKWEITDRDAIRAAFGELLARRPTDGRPVAWPAPGDFLDRFNGVAKKQQTYDKPSLAWHRNDGNKSLVAKAHCSYNAVRLKMPVPSWAMPGSDSEGLAIERLVADIHAEQAATSQRVCRPGGVNQGKAGADLARDAGEDAGDRDLDREVQSGRYAGPKSEVEW